MLQVVVIPEGSHVDFHYCEMMEGLMGAKWKYGEPIVKVFGEIIVESKNTQSIHNYVTSIFFKTVSEFTIKKDNEGKMLIFQKIADKVD